VLLLANKCTKEVCAKIIHTTAQYFINETTTKILTDRRFAHNINYSRFVTANCFCLYVYHFMPGVAAISEITSHTVSLTL